MTRSKTATLWELDCILHRATKLTDRNFTIFPPSDSEGNLLVDETPKGQHYWHIGGMNSKALSKFEQATGIKTGKN